MELTLKPIDKDFKDWERLDQINVDAFPEIERIATAELEQKLGDYGCKPYAIYDKDRDKENYKDNKNDKDKETQKENLVGFIAIMNDPKLQLSFLWFLAIAPELRSKGYGSATLKLLKELYPGQIVLDMERIYPEAENYQQRLDRTRFYERNGLVRAGVGIKYLGMDLELMCTNPPLRLVELEDMLNRLPKEKFHPYLYPLNDGKSE